MTVLGDQEDEEAKDFEPSNSPKKLFNSFDYTQLPFLDFDEIPKDIDILDNVKIKNKRI